VASNVAVLLTVFVPAISSWRDRHLQETISHGDQEQRTQIAAASQKLETLNRQVEVTRLLFEHFFGKPANEQRAVVNYLTFQFPHDLRKQSLQQILFVEAKPGVVRQITKSVAAVQPNPVGLSKVDLAVAKEREGFRSLLAGDLASARRAFAAAYDAYPTYHNVDELSHKVLTESTVVSYGRSSAAGRARVLHDTLDVVLTAYAWGIPAELARQLHTKLERLS
jgi:hypothetical protein